MSAMTVACIGGCHVDAKAVTGGPVRMGTSNPVRVTRTPGGVACNVARWLARLSIPVELFSIVGDDALGRDLLARLGSEGVGVDGIAVASGETTAAYTAVLDDSGGLAVGIADMGIYDRLDAAWAAGALDATRASLLVIDANPTAEAIAVVAKGKAGRWLAADPVSVDKARRVAPILDRLDAVFPDTAEAGVLGGSDDPAAAAAAIVRLGTGTVVVTLGSDGVLVAAGSEVGARAVVRPAGIVDVTGAGDALLAGYVAAVVMGERDPVGWGLAAASLAVETADTVPEGVGVEAVRARLP